MDRKKYRNGALYIAAALAALVTVMLSRCFIPPTSAVSDAQLAQVDRGDLDIQVQTVGVLDAARTHMVSSAVRGDKGKIIFLVEDGSVVAQDDVLVRLDPTPFETELHRFRGEVRSLAASVDSAKQMLEWEKNQTEREIQTSKYNLTVARLELRRLVEGEGPLQLAQYKSELDKAKDEFNRYQSYIVELGKLQDQGFANPTEMTQARQKVEQLDELYQTARQRYDSYKEHVLPTSIETARAKVDKSEMEIQQLEKGTAFKVARAAAVLAEVQGKLETAQASLEQALAELKKTTIRAPFGGIAILYETFRDGQKRKPRVGDRVWQNQPLLYLPDISTMIVKTQIREVDLHKVAMDQPCRIRVDAYPETLISGKVTLIGMLATERFDGGIGEKYFQLTVTLAGKNDRLRPGMTARITVNSENAADILFVPVHAVFDEGSGTFCYLLVKGGRFREKAVVVGRQNEDSVEIISGLDQGDRVSLLKPPPDRILPDNSQVTVNENTHN
jgi:HlyD family secretion protein